MNKADKATLTEIIRTTSGKEAKVALATLVEDFPEAITTTLLAAKIAVALVG